MQLGRVHRSTQDLNLVPGCCKCMQCCVSLPALFQGGTGAALTSLLNQLGVPDVSDATVSWPKVPVLSVYYCHRLMLAKREAKAVTEADTEALDWWYDLEDDFELLSFKAWNAVIYQVTPCSLLSLLCIPTDCLP